MASDPGGFRTKKCFGQNFLRDRQVVARILEAAQLEASDRVLEIGPGLGALTESLLARAGEVRIMEVDRDLIAHWQQRGAANLVICAGDALRLDWELALPQPPYKLVANLPYNISSQVVFKLLDERARFSRLVLMFQKEVGDRLRALPGSKDYGILSVFCRRWFEIAKVTDVAPQAFSPPPKVQSIVLAFTPLAQPRVAVADEALFRRVVKGAFGQRRKTLRNALSGSGLSAELCDAALTQSGIDGRRRGETLTLEEFAALSDAAAALGAGGEHDA